jgi:alkylation response protein AidB-like acyl-CoA dehydrogenase
MIDRFIPEAHQPYIKLARDFARKDIAPDALKNDVPLNANKALMQTASEIGFLNLTEDYGVTPGLLAQILAIISEADASMAVVIFTHTAAMSILHEALEGPQLSLFQDQITGSGNLPLAFQSYSCPDEIDMPQAEERNGKYFLQGELTTWRW